MSRVGKLPVEVVSGVNVSVSGQEVNAKGPKGQGKLKIADEIKVTYENNKIWLKPSNDTKKVRALWGLSRNLVNNLVKGVQSGFSITLEIEGVGYKAAVQGKTLKLNMGFSHDVNYPIPQGIEIKCEKPTTVVISGADKQLVGHVAAEIRGVKKPEPYKGKGIRYSTERIRRKEGKKK